MDVFREPSRPSFRLYSLRHESTFFPAPFTQKASRPVTRGMNLLLILGLLAGLFGCGPASSGDPSSQKSSAGTSVAPGSQPTPATGSAPPAGAAGTTLSATAPPPPEKPLVVPTWMATALANPDVQVRLQALDTWVRQGRTGSVDPLMLALNDPDERVRARALQLIEQDWVTEQAAQPKQPKPSP